MPRPTRRAKTSGTTGAGRGFTRLLDFFARMARSTAARRNFRAEIDASYLSPENKTILKRGCILDILGAIAKEARRPRDLRYMTTVGVGVGFIPGCRHRQCILFYEKLRSL